MEWMVRQVSVTTLDFTVNRVLMKLFKTSSHILYMQILLKTRDMFDIKFPSMQLSVVTALRCLYSQVCIYYYCTDSCRFLLILRHCLKRSCEFVKNFCVLVKRVFFFLYIFSIVLRYCFYHYGEWR